jgi:hypothetical protein
MQAWSPLVQSPTIPTHDNTKSIITWSQHSSPPQLLRRDGEIGSDLAFPCIITCHLPLHSPALERHSQQDHHLRDFFCKHQTDPRSCISGSSHPSADFPAPSGILLASLASSRQARTPLPIRSPRVIGVITTRTRKRGGGGRGKNWRTSHQRRKTQAIPARFDHSRSRFMTAVPRQSRHQPILVSDKLHPSQLRSDILARLRSILPPPSREPHHGPLVHSPFTTLGNRSSMRWLARLKKLLETF